VVTVLWPPLCGPLANRYIPGCTSCRAGYEEVSSCNSSLSMYLFWVLQHVVVALQHRTLHGASVCRFVVVIAEMMMMIIITKEED